MYVYKSFNLDVARAAGELVNSPGTGLFIASRVPLGAKIALDSIDGPRIDISEGDTIRVPFDRFYIFHDYVDAGVFKLVLFTAGEMIERQLQSATKRRASIVVQMTSTVGKQWAAKLYNGSVAGAAGRLCRLRKVQMSSQTTGKGIQYCSIVIAGGTQVWSLTGGSTLFTGSYTDTRVPTAEVAPLKAEYAERAAPSQAYTMRKMIDANAGAPSVEFDLEWAIAPTQYVSVWFYPGDGIEGHVSAQYDDEG